MLESGKKVSNFKLQESFKAGIVVQDNRRKRLKIQNLRNNFDVNREQKNKKSFKL